MLHRIKTHIPVQNHYFKHPDSTLKANSFSSIIFLYAYCYVWAVICLWQHSNNANKRDSRLNLANH